MTTAKELMNEFPALPDAIFMVEDGEVVAVALGQSGYYPQPNLTGYCAEGTADKLNSLYIHRLVSDYPDLMDRIKWTYKLCSMFGWVNPVRQANLEGLHTECLGRISR